MTRRITAAMLGEQARTIGQPPTERVLDLDPQLRAYLEAERQKAYASGYETGRSEGTAETLNRSDALARAITLACAETVEHLESARRANIGGMVDLARAMAEVVLGRTPHDGGAAVLARTREVLERLDERELAISVHPDDLQLVASGLSDHLGATVNPDPSLQPGEARVRGGWSHADLTRAAAWDAVQAAIDDVD